MTQMIKQWWTDRSIREQVLLASLSLIAVLLIAFQFVVRPLVEYRAAAAAANQEAMAYLKDVESSAATIIGLQDLIRIDVDADIQTMRTAVSTAARDAGIAITRLQPITSGGLDVWLDNAESTSLFNWTVSLHEKYGIGVTRASIQRNDDATVRAQISLSGGGES